LGIGTFLPAPALAGIPESTKHDEIKKREKEAKEQQLCEMNLSAK
jgi:hypothetical protein